eukprot:gene12022-8276_t
MKESGKEEIRSVAVESGKKCVEVQGADWGAIMLRSHRVSPVGDGMKKIYVCAVSPEKAEMAFDQETA